jgi:hypothetical protein
LSDKQSDGSSQPPPFGTAVLVGVAVVISVGVLVGVRDGSWHSPPQEPPWKTTCAVTTSLRQTALGRQEDTSYRLIRRMMGVQISDPPLGLDHFRLSA